LNAAVSKDRLKRKLRHLCRFLALVAIVWLIHKSHQDFLVELGDRGHPIELPDAQLYLPTVTSLEPDPDDPAFLQALDANGTELGLVSQTSPTGDSAIGFSGSTNLLVVWNRKDRVSSVSIRSSGDTKDHVDAILEDPNFFRQFEGKSMDDLAQGEEINAVSGATLTSLAIADALSIRFGGTAKASRFPDQIRVKEVTPYFPTCAKLRPSRTHTSLFEVLDENGSMLGQVGRTSPHADKIIGYQGPIDVLLILENNGTLKAMQMRSSFENPPYADYPNDDYYLPSLFEGRSIPQLAEMNETAERYEGVSGATMTSMAMAEGIVETARQWELERTRTGREKSRIAWGVGETGSLAVILLAGFVAFTKRGKTKFFRRSLQVLLVCYLGLVNGDILSQALFAGWAQNGVPWERAPILVLLTLAALLVPMATGKSFYCHQLCPHGAAQQWMRKLRKSPLRLPAKLGKVL
jgi:Na+-translocating ferredoxin:NAD+ oxidoreductase RnfG subunit